MSVRENVQLALLAHAGAHGGIGAARPIACALKRALLERVGMTRLADHGCATLAYGDAKRVELALALAGKPRLLLMDEPTAGMSPRSRDRLMQLAAEVARSERSRPLSPSTTWTSCSGTPIASSCSIAAGSSPKARPPRFAPTPRCRPSIWGGKAGQTRLSIERVRKQGVSTKSRV
jgi:hypothetical protein